MASGNDRGGSSGGSSARRGGGQDRDQDRRLQAPAASSGASVRGRLQARDANGRPMAVYAVLGAGVTVLVILLLIIYVTADQRENPDQPICTTVDPASVGTAVRDGQVERLTLAYDTGVETPSSDRWGPVLARVDYTDGRCANLPQGIVNQGGIYAIVGMISVYNETTENTQVEIRYEGSDTLDGSLYVTPTTVPVPAGVPPPTEPPVPTGPVTPESPAATPAASPAVDATPQA